MSWFAVSAKCKKFFFFVVSRNVQGYNGFISVVESIDHKVPKTECVHHGNAYPEWTQLVSLLLCLSGKQQPLHHHSRYCTYDHHIASPSHHNRPRKLTWMR